MPARSLVVSEPALVNDHEMINFHTHAGTDYVSVLTFSPEGEVLIGRHEMVR